MNYNKAVIIGHLTRDVELRTTNSGTSVANFGVAVNHKWRNAAGEKQESVTFLDAKAWGATGENIAKFFGKGSCVLLEGRLEQENWEDKTDGSKRSKIVLVVERFEFGPKSQPEEGRAGDGRQEPHASGCDPRRLDTFCAHRLAMT